MSNILERLQWASLHGTQEEAITVMAAAAAEIERLWAELQTVHAHLQHYRDLIDEKRATIADLTEALDRLGRKGEENGST